MNDGPHEDTPSLSLASSILDGLKRQDARAWERLERLFQPVVRDWCLRKGVSDSDADDVCQQVFLAVHKNVAEFRREQPGDSFRGWIWTITQRKIIDFFRQARQPAAGGTEHQLALDQLPDTAGGSLSMEPPAEAEQSTQVLMQAVLAELKDDFGATSWAAFRGMVIDGRAAEDLAGELGTTAKAIRQAKYRILSRLRHELAELG